MKSNFDRSCVVVVLLRICAQAVHGGTGAVLPKDSPVSDTGTCAARTQTRKRNDCPHTNTHTT